MQDVLLKQNSDGLYDLVTEGGSLASAEGFESALVVSYFTDSRAPAVQVQEARHRRGWAGNISTILNERQLGGLLWLLDQVRIVADTLNLAEGYARGSLDWMAEDNVIRSVAIKAEKIGTRTINILTDITSIDNTVKRYVTLWRNTDFTRILP